MTTSAVKSWVLSPNSHHELIDACRKGDQKAQFQIYKLYYRAMYSISLGIVKNPMEAEDVMQESFLSAFEEIHKYPGNIAFGVWLMNLVQNRSIDSLQTLRGQEEI